MKRTKIVAAGALSLALVACTATGERGGSAGGSDASAATERPPNVVIVFTDDQGYGDLSSSGHPTIRTPNIDALVAGGTKFTQFYVASPVCSPSRAALLTGAYPKRVGMHKHVIFPAFDYGLHTDEVTIADLLREQGYATGCFGKWHLGHRPGMMPTDQGFDTYFGVPYSNDMSQFHRPPDNKYAFRLPLMRDLEVVEWEPDQGLLTRRCTEEAVAFIEANRERPFFVYVPHSMPHIPLYASPELEGTSRRGLYGDVIEEIDWSVGRLVETLDEHDLLQNTIVLFSSDNGPWLQFKLDGGSAGLLRGGKGTNWEGGQRVPFVAHWPAGIPAGRVCPDVMTALDVVPTLATLVGAELPADRELDGRDVSHVLRGEDWAGPEPEFLYYTANGKLAGIRRGPWKLLLEGEELYQLEHDVSETQNVAADHPQLVAELRVAAWDRDAEITEEARSVLVTDLRIFDPNKP